MTYNVLSGTLSLYTTTTTASGLRSADPEPASSQAALRPGSKTQPNARVAAYLSISYFYRAAWNADAV